MKVIIDKMEDDLRGMPYFMENDAWYYTDLELCNEYGGNIHLTELGKSIPSVVASYDEFYTPEYDEDGNIVDL